MEIEKNICILNTQRLLKDTQSDLKHFKFNIVESDPSKF